ncbi:MAG: mannan-binding protein [Limnoraphis robusta]
MTNNCKQSKTKKLLLSLATFIVASFAIFAFSSPAFALDVKAGPIWNNDDAKVKCPVAAQVYNAQWNGQWTTTVPGQMSVCGTNAAFLPTISLPGDVNAGPIWNNDDAKVKCPVAAASANGVWNGNWVTTLPGKMSVCGVK